MFRQFHPHVRHASTSTHSIARPTTRSAKVQRETKCIRNVGIIAHIDAGKTTMTERMLHVAGVTPYVGEVTDFLAIERQRGITINAAAVTLPWRGQCVNLVDTPGHVDFTLEVERSLRVLDGVVCLLDASAGVQAQTMTVWRCARRYDTPAIVCLNKMDKKNASIERCISSIIERMAIRPLLVHSPIYTEGIMTGVVDLVRMTSHRWPSGHSSKESRSMARMMEVTALTSNSALYDEAMRARETLVGDVCEVDAQFADVVLAADQSDDVTEALADAIRWVRVYGVDYERCRKSTHSCVASPVVLASALRSVGTQTLLDTIVDYAPSPTDYGSEQLCALAFKTEQDARLGRLTYVRVYSGSIESGANIFNANRQHAETGLKLYLPHSNQIQEVSVVHAGDLCVLTGMKRTVTGDTIVDKAGHDAAHMPNSSTHGDQVLLDGVSDTSRVFYCTVEAPSPSAQLALDTALGHLVTDDPSLRVRRDNEQTVLESCGELHVDVVKDRLLHEYGLDAFIGRLAVNYKESIDEEIEFSHTQTTDENEITVKLRLSPATGKGTPSHVYTVQTNKKGDNKMAHVHPRRLGAIEMGVRMAADRGPIMGHPVVDVRVGLVDLTTRGRLTMPELSNAACICMERALSHASLVLLEPVMRVVITLDETAVGMDAVTQEMGKRGAHMLSLDHEGVQPVLVFNAPLVQLLDLATTLRRLTKGTAHLHMDVAQMQKVDVESVQHS